MSHRESHLIFTVTNDLTYDQRMQRICQSLAAAGYLVTLVGTQKAGSAVLLDRPYRQARIPVNAEKGKKFYLEYNFKLYRWLIAYGKANPGNAMAICAIDLDTILPVYYASKKLKALFAYDAHELFTELTEVKRRPFIQQVWKAIERYTVPKIALGYTVNKFIANKLEALYKVNFKVIRNLPIGKRDQADASFSLPALPNQFFLYQGAVNEGRAFDTLIPAMRQSPFPLVIAGDGNYMEAVKALIQENAVADKVILLGMLQPHQLAALTPKAFAGITIFDNSGLNQYYSLANRFFDYIQAGIPQICVNYPEYQIINQEFQVALMVDDVREKCLAESMNKLVEDHVLYQTLKHNTSKASEMLCWENEQQKLIEIWKEKFPVRN